MDLVSIIIPCYNPTEYLLKALNSARSQDYPEIEIVLVNDGSTLPASLDVLRSAATKADRYLEQSNLGPAAARNVGIREARGRFIVPLDDDDLLEPAFVSECIGSSYDNPDAGFVYPDYRVFGSTNYPERLSDYNLYRLLDMNTLIYAALIRKDDWELAGGYDEQLQKGYEDWDFWLRLGEKGRFGHHIRKFLFQYRKHGRTRQEIAQEHHAELISHIQAHHPNLYQYHSRARIKAIWEPSAVVVSSGVVPEQTIEDLQLLTESEFDTLAKCRAPVLLFPSIREIDSHAAEFGALAIWGGRDRFELGDGSLAISLEAYDGIVPREHAADLPQTPTSSGQCEREWPGPMRQLRRHLVNANLLSGSAWAKHPFRSLLRLVPLRIKERVNRWCGKPVFDLRFYLRFRPDSLLLCNSVAQPLRYMPKVSDRRRIALVTPHLGPGGAEGVLLEIAGSLDRSSVEISVIATQSRDSRWISRWSATVDHTYDLEALVSEERLVAALYSVITNWRFDAVLIQNTMIAYIVIRELSKALPHVRLMDLIHSIEPEWDIVASTLPAARYLQTRVVISEAARRHLQAAGVAEKKIRLIRNGIDLNVYTPSVVGRSHTPARIVFAGRLDPVKRPLLLVDIARALPNGAIRISGFSSREPGLRNLRFAERSSGLGYRNCSSWSDTSLACPRYSQMPISWSCHPGMKEFH